MGDPGSDARKAVSATLLLRFFIWNFVVNLAPSSDLWVWTWGTSPQGDHGSLPSDGRCIANNDQVIASLPLEWPRSSKLVVPCRSSLAKLSPNPLLSPMYEL